jgi:hypothetical protein
MICSECKKPIEDGMQITVYKSNFHTGCAIEAVKKAREKHGTGNTRRDQGNEGRVGEPVNALSH